MKLEDVKRDGVWMPDGRHWVWCGHAEVINKEGKSVRVEVWSSSSRYCCARFTIRQKLLGGAPSYNLKPRTAPSTAVSVRLRSTAKGWRAQCLASSARAPTTALSRPPAHPDAAPAPARKIALQKMIDGDYNRPYAEEEPPP